MKHKHQEVLGYFALGLILFTLLNLPAPFMSRLRGSFIFASKLYAARGVSDVEIELMRLRIENEALKEQISQVREWLSQEERVEGYLKKLEKWSNDRGFEEFYKRRIRDFSEILTLQIHSIEAKVIFRDPAVWSSGMWVSRGEGENRRLGRKVVAKNSPVIVGNSLVGVVEEVEEYRSYVRLITDSQLTPAVRAVRGGEANLHIYEIINQLSEELELREDLEKKEAVLASLEVFKQALLEQGETRYLAKGELRGSSYPVWRQRSDVLKGIGFNYEFADEEGQAMRIHEQSSKRMLKKGDLLITSGLDGVFPRGLNVAIVKKIAPLKEGSFSYELEAISTCSNLQELTTVRICPPICRSLN